ncbi:MAG TPA: tetratricopeptide repeat protein [Ktedonobacteraceae bacterium]|jgi:tetratricopeptide (TPR) repeat protein
MPGNKDVFSAAMNAADRHLWNSHWTEALQAYQQALVEFPEDVATHSGLGFCYMQTKQWSHALEEYAHVLKSEPNNIIALSKTAELYGILNRREDAYHAYLQLADLYSQAGQGTRAEAGWQKAVQLSPGNPEPHERLATYYFEKKDIVQMIQHRLAAAQDYLLRNQLALAREQCEEVLRADGTNVQVQQILMQINAESEFKATGISNPLALIAEAPSVYPGNNAGDSMDRTLANHTDPDPFGDRPAKETFVSKNTSGGNTGIMNNMGSAGNYGGVGNSGPASTMSGNGGGMNSAPQQRITANQVTEALQQAQVYQDQGRFNDAIDLCEQILASGFDRSDARYFLGWLYQEQQRWDEAIEQFQALLNDPDYALSCYYSLGQCYRARGDLRAATVHFDEAVDRVNLDALTVEESDQLVQLCQEAAEAHRLLGEQEQAFTVYNALLGFLRSRGWNDKVAQVEFMLQQAQNSPAPDASLLTSGPQAGSPQMSAAEVPEAPTVAINTASVAGNPQAPASSTGELPDWLTGILNDEDKTQKASQPATPPAQAAPIIEQPAPIQPQTSVVPPAVSAAPSGPVTPPSAPSWLTDNATPNVTRILPPEAPTPPVAQPPAASVPAPQALTAAPQVAPVSPAPAPAPQAPIDIFMQPPLSASPLPPIDQSALSILGTSFPPSQPVQPKAPAVEDLLNQMAGTKATGLNDVADAVLASTASLPENVRLQVVRSMQDIQKYINHGLLTPAKEECLRVINTAPQYLDVHQVLCEIYVREGSIDQAIPKYAVLVDTYIANGRIDDAIATYRRILQLDSNNITYRMRLINLLSAQGNTEDLLRERTLAAESYLRLGYVDRAMTELEQALQENPTNVPTRLNYALALQKLGRTQEAVAEYQRVLQVDPRNVTALVRWHIAMVTNQGTPRAKSLEALSRIRWQLRGQGQKYAEFVIREYLQALDLYPNNADIHYALGQIYQQCGQYDLALDSYLLGTRDNAVEVLARVSTAQTLFAQGRPEPAMQHLEQALQQIRQSSTTMDPATWAARPREEGEEHQAPEMEISLQLAQAYKRTGRQEQMQAILRQVKQLKTGQDEVVSTLADISTSNNDPESTMREHLDLVKHYRQNRQTDNALNTLNEMVRFAPEDPRAHEELADIYIHRGLLDEGIAELRILADIYLRNGNLEQAATKIQRIGNIYAEMGNNDEALSSLFRAAELDGESTDLLREVVSLCLQLGRNQDAARYQIQIARHYVNTEQIKDAVAALQQLITIDRNNYEAYDLLGQTYQSVGEYEQASRVYRNLAKMNPGSSIARERLATLQELRTAR